MEPAGFMEVNPDSRARSHRMLQKVSFYFYVFYCFEVGIFLLVAPWMLPHVWEQNYFYFLYPSLKALFMSGYFRGAVSGLGLLNISLGILDLIQHEKMKRYRNL